MGQLLTLNLDFMKRIKLKTKEHGTMLSTNEMKCILGGEKIDIYNVNVAHYQLL